jgi:hypothetical protein
VIAGVLRVGVNFRLHLGGGSAGVCEGLGPSRAWVSSGLVQGEEGGVGGLDWGLGSGQPL